MKNPKPDPTVYFDHSALLQRMDNDEEFTRMIVKDSIVSLRKRYDEIQKLVGSDDAHAVKSVSHSLKGLSKIVSFNKLADICFKLEKRAAHALKSGNAFESITQSDIMAIKEALDGAENTFNNPK